MSKEIPSPYKGGLQLEIHRHRPPTPFGYEHCIQYDDPNDGRPWKTYNYFWGDRAGLVDFALAHPPMNTEPLTPDPEQTQVATLTIHEVVRDLKDEQTAEGPTLLRGQISTADGQPTLNVLPKLYDAVFNSIDGGLEYGYIDPVTQADLDYSKEAAAYKDIDEAGLCGSAALVYLGSWTADIPIDNEAGGMRPVRMILLQETGIERARTMAEIIEEHRIVDRSRLPALPVRLEVLKNFLDAENKIWWFADVEHDDPSPDDFLVRKDNTEALMSFQHSIVYNHVPSKRDKSWVAYEKGRTNTPELMPNPVLRQWPFIPYSERSTWWEWVPEEWLEDPELATIWLLETFALSEAFKRNYQPLPNEFLNSHERGDRGAKLLALLEQLGRNSGATSEDEDEEKVPGH
ncbi:hypothetical protein QBC35DRAFT_394793 [Podospora australis]|uniref:Uncharacterized protein n=1 Tax=Podospora australis TaxID=1536484 RepID=A0AAN6WKF6_9PEZI|nr:hypothetical protein QBC35DRAFT_394793 [Podospora australis]